MKLLYFDCFSGISGDMTLGALIDLGVPQAYLKEQLACLALPGYTIRITRTARMGIAGRSVRVREKAAPAHPHRSFGSIKKMIGGSTLSAAARELSIRMFERLARAEAEIHRKKIDDVHFHEVGALDSIVDIAGCAACIDYLGIDACCASEIPLGHGFVQCAHGRLPVPAPATLKLLKGVPVYAGGVEAEMVTPTGAAIVTTLAERFGSMPAMEVSRIGYGAGSRDLEDRPNMLRLVLGRLRGKSETDTVCVIEASIDDMNPELAGHLIERLLAEGALDALCIPVQMKKNRPGIILQTLCSEDKRSLLTEVLFAESTTAGVRVQRADRSVLPRRTGRVKTKYGTLQVKIIGEGSRERVVPEFEECRRAALKKNAPLRDVYEEVMVKGKNNIKK